jgi:hypothetical protein
MLENQSAYPAAQRTRLQRGRLVFAAVALLLASGLALVLLAPRFKKIERRAPSTLAVVQMTVPGDVERVEAAIQAIFNDEKDLNQGTHRLPREDFFSHFYLYPRAHPIFPDTFQIQYWAGKDPYLRPYAALAADRTQHDLYLYEPTGDQYWPSDYYYNGVPARFRCAFFIHLEADPHGGTNIAVFEYLPTLWVGERIGFSAHAIGPASLHDIRVVESTYSDRVRLLQKIGGGLVHAGETRAQAHAKRL